MSPQMKALALTTHGDSGDMGTLRFYKDLRAASFGDIVGTSGDQSDGDMGTHRQTRGDMGTKGRQA